MPQILREPLAPLLVARALLGGGGLPLCMRVREKGVLVARSGERKRGADRVGRRKMLNRPRTHSRALTHLALLRYTFLIWTTLARGKGEWAWLIVAPSA